MYLIDKAQRDTLPTLTSVVSESFPHLRRGAIRDFERIMKEHKYFKDARWNTSNSTYTFETGSKLEFFSADEADKLRGGRRDRLFINECNNITFQAFEELEVRTREFIILDWNPTNEFWFYTDVLHKRNDVEHIILTYRDNEALDVETRKSIEQRKARKGWWQVYGEGLLGEVEGKIYKDWQIIDEVPFNAKLIRRGLDFGYTNDPTALIAIYKYNNGLIINEEIYQKGLSNKQIADIISNVDEAQIPIVADSAEPKSIDELRLYGLVILGAHKGKDSIRQGIQLVQDQRISVTKRSINTIREYRNYLWQTDKDGKFISPNIPEDGFNHSMDALRYAIESMRTVDAKAKQFYPKLQEKAKQFFPGR